MTKEITKAFILQQIQDKFKLRELVPEIFTFSEMVVPVYSVEEHLNYTTADYRTESVTGTGAVLFFTVPDTERWFLQRYSLVFVGAGAYTVAGVYVRREKEVRSGVVIYLDLTAAQTISYAVDLPKTVRLDPGDTIQATIDGYTSPQDLRLYIDYLKEELR